MIRSCGKLLVRCFSVVYGAIHKQVEKGSSESINRHIQPVKSIGRKNEREHTFKYQARVNPKYKDG